MSAGDWVVVQSLIQQVGIENIAVTPATDSGDVELKWRNAFDVYHVNNGLIWVVGLGVYGYRISS